MDSIYVTPFGHVISLEHLRGISTIDSHNVNGLLKIQFELLFDGLMKPIEIYTYIQANDFVHKMSNIHPVNKRAELCNEYIKNLPESIKINKNRDIIIQAWKDYRGKNGQ